MMTKQPEAQCEDSKEVTTTRGARSARTPSPVAGRRQRSSANRTKSPGSKRSQHRLGLRRSLSKRNVSGGETDQQQQQQETSQMRRTNSFDKHPMNRRRGSGSHSRRNRRSTCEDPQDGADVSSMRRNQSFGKQMNRSTHSTHSTNSNNNNHNRRFSKSPVAKRKPPVTLNGSGVVRDRSAARRRTKQTSRRANSTNNASVNLEIAQLNVFQTFERGMNSSKPQLIPSDVSESSDPSSLIEKTILPAAAAPSEDGGTRHTIPGLNKPTKEQENRETVTQRSSDPVKLELDGGVQHAGPYGRRFSWWNLPSSRDLDVGMGDMENDDDDDMEEDDLPPPVVPPSRRKSLMMQEGEQSASKLTLTPKQANKRSSNSNKKKKKKATRTKSLDNTDSGFAVITEDDKASLRAAAIDALLSPPAPQKRPIRSGQDLLSPLPALPKQHSSGTCTTESTSGSGSSGQQKRSSKERRAKKTKRKSSGSKRGTRSVIRLPETDNASGSNNQATASSKLSLDDHFSRSMNTSFSRSMNRSCDFSAYSRGSTKKSTRTSMSIKPHSLDASRSSMSISLSSDDEDLLSIGSDFEGSADFDFDDTEEDDDFPTQPPKDAGTMSISHNNNNESGFFHGEDSFRVMDEDSKRELRCRMKDKTQRPSGGSSSHSRSIRRDRISPLAKSMEQGIAVMQM